MPFFIVSTLIVRTLTKKRKINFFVACTAYNTIYYTYISTYTILTSYTMLTLH